MNKPRVSDCKNCGHRFDWHYSITHQGPCEKTREDDTACPCPGYVGMDGRGLPPAEWIEQSLREISRAVIGMFQELP